MDRPERRRKSQSLRPMRRMPFCWPVTKTISQAMPRTTTVRIAVPRFDSTPSTPILPKIEVRLANSADRQAKSSHLPSGFPSVSVSFREIISSVPIPIPSTPTICGAETGSPSRRKARRMVSTVLDLSMGATLLTSPSCSARK